MLDFNGKVAVITGGASGVGRALGDRLVREGARVVLADIDQSRLDVTVAEIGAEAGLAVDVTKEASVAALADSIFDRFGAVHLLFNNAGVADTLPKEVVVRVNILAPIRLTNALLPQIPEGGAVVTTASIAGSGWPQRAAMIWLSPHGSKIDGTRMMSAPA